MLSEANCQIASRPVKVGSSRIGCRHGVQTGRIDRADSQAGNERCETQVHGDDGPGAADGAAAQHDADCQRQETDRRLRACMQNEDDGKQCDRPAAQPRARAKAIDAEHGEHRKDRGRHVLVGEMAAPVAGMPGLQRRRLMDRSFGQEYKGGIVDDEHRSSTALAQASTNSFSLRGKTSTPATMSMATRLSVTPRAEAAGS